MSKAESNDRPLSGERERSGSVAMEIRDEKVCILTLSNPGKRNALSTDMMIDLERAYASIAAAPEVRSVVLIGEGSDFCAGADIASLAALEGIASARDHIAAFRRVYQGLFDVRKPTVCAASGYVLGAGLELCLAADIVVVDSTAKMGLPEVKLGAVPGYAMVALSASVGRTRALDLMLSGRMIDAQQALDWGLASRSAEDGSAQDAAIELGVQLASGAPVAQEIIKRTVARPVSEADWELFVSGSSSALSSEDAAIGMAAFARKERPVFGGR